MARLGELSEELGIYQWKVGKGCLGWRKGATIRVLPRRVERQKGNRWWDDELEGLKKRLSGLRKRVKSGPDKGLRRVW